MSLTLYQLGSYTFALNPIEMDILESKKEVAEVKTYTGSSVFQWDALISGESVTMYWPTMTLTMYAQLRTLYLSASEIAFVPGDGYTYQVIVTDLNGEYFKYLTGATAYRKEVKLTLNIRSQTAV